LYAGIKGGAGGNIISEGWLYAQGDAFINVNLFEVSNMNFYLGGNVIWRNHQLTSHVQSAAGYGDPTYFYGFSTASLKQMNYGAHVGIWHKIFFIEIGWEAIGYKSLSVSGPQLTGSNATAENLQKLSDSNNSTQESLNKLSYYSQFYYSIGVALALF